MINNNLQKKIFIETYGCGQGIITDDNENHR